MLKHTPEISARLSGSLYGFLIADALSMPVHWYYDRLSLHKDYGLVRDYQQPRNPHPDSILWRSRYRPAGPEADILHNQAMFWGERGVHYHQFLRAGENTLNIKLSRLLMDHILTSDAYDQDRYLARYVSFLTTPGKHNETYIEECHREFFKAWVLRKKGKIATTPEEKHIGGLCLPIPILLFFHDEPLKALQIGQAHLELTHPGPLMRDAFSAFGIILQSVLDGADIRQALEMELPEKPSVFTAYSFDELAELDDADVAMNVFSTACYVQQSLPLAFYLAWKYQDDPEQALIVNTNLGGDNCHRGAVLGALLGAMHGERAWPERWIDGLLDPPIRFKDRLTDDARIRA
ncbi:ADP-ribosylglycohydrolase family protein [Desulfonatronum sp. SC1]|uniref:ADP-ribosylglycohydrolase family protein n=1 Tax=Desulfonatronum sp. SC1 TaxID=2109626 RepID=UPI000D300BF7|nr:ADP-ribosylglycohydrolase family protein [Desulfonatronum sp. SC1]PTN37032.1 ADP-ribosylglycohydrolase family protein [Desulfonatronum sp. SC1]